jgi:hypothetical protein
VRKLAPLAVRTSTVADVELAVADVELAVADVPEDADGAELCALPELQAAARTPAAASGAPSLRASETFLDASSLFICYAFLFRRSTER